MHPTRFLSAKDVSRLVSVIGPDRIMDELLEGFEKACREYDPATCLIPSRTGFHYQQPHSGLVEWMPLMSRGDRILMKMVGYHPQNPEIYQIPTILCTLALFDARTGLLIAAADGSLLTALRTGAASAVASRLLAHPASRTLGLIGAGAQAVTQLHALSRVFPLERVLVHDLDRKRAASLSSRVAPLRLGSVEIEAREVVDLLPECDLLCTATSVAPGAGPVFGADLPANPWLHINAVGSDFPGKVEIPLEFLRRSFVCPDFREQGEKEGECQQLDHTQIGPELLEVVKAPDQFIQHREELSVFDSTGFALEDLVALELLMEYAEEQGVGTFMKFANMTSNPYHPYQFLEEPACRPGLSTTATS